MIFNRIFQRVKSHPYECLTGIAILIFLLFKVEDLLIPFHWDEMGVYAHAAFLMNDTHKISLLPGSIDPYYSRGHPLLFTFCNSIVFRIFGESVLAGHLFALFISLATLVMFLLFARSIFNSKVAFFATTLLCIQPIFYSLAGQLLPEMMLTLFTLGCFYGILQHKWVMYAIFGSLAILTKESAIIIPSTALILVFTDSMRGRDFFTFQRWRIFLLAAVPLIVFGLFLIIQRIQMGWFLFPLHTGYIHWKPDILLRDSGRIFRNLFLSQGRFVTGIPFLAGIVMILFAKSFGFVRERRILFVFLVYILLAFIFIDINYFLSRYLLFVIPFIVLGGTWITLTTLEKLFSATAPLKWVLILIFTGTGILLGHLNMYTSLNSCDMSYKYIVNACLPAIQWAELNWKNETIEVNFPIYQGLEDPANGYLKGKPIPYSVNFMAPTRYGLFFYFSKEEIVPSVKSHKYHIIKIFNDHYANVCAVEFEPPSLPPSIFHK